MQLIDIKNESFRSLTVIIRRRALRSSRSWREWPRTRPSRGFEPFVTRRNALESRADRGMRAYVTSGDPLMTTLKPAPCERATASRHVGWRAQGSRIRADEGLAQHAPHDGGALRVGLRGMAGGACVPSASEESTTTDIRWPVPLVTLVTPIMALPGMSRAQIMDHALKSGRPAETLCQRGAHW